MYLELVPEVSALGQVHKTALTLLFFYVQSINHTESVLGVHRYRLESDAEAGGEEWPEGTEVNMKEIPCRVSEMHRLPNSFYTHDE